MLIQPDIGFIVVMAILFVMLMVTMGIVFLRKDKLKTVEVTSDSEVLETEPEAIKPHERLDANGLQAATGSLMLLLYPLVPACFALFANGMEDYALRLFILVMGIFCAAFTDIGAYVIGTLIGGKKLCPAISPQKTVAGAVGGVICATLFGVAAGFFFTSNFFVNDVLPQWFGSVFFNRGLNLNYALNTNLNLAFWVFPIVALLLSFVSILGDLIESGFKRKLGIKDFSSVLSAHGGVLDRLDSMVFSLAASTILFMVVADIITFALN